ncbi:MAG: alanine--tRNA ligase [Actinomycetota bacterium]
MDSNELRAAFTGFFTDRGHLARPSASLIPHEPSLLFTVAGMVPFMPYFLGEEHPPAPRITTVQKCVRAGGKQNDLDEVGRTKRHLTFFEMLGNFSFGDYFKADAIPYAWEFFTEVLGLDPDRLWVTVHLTDDDAERIWIDDVGVPADRVQRLGDDNWWAAGDTGPCGPCSEIFYDKGPDYGDDGGPAHGGDERYVEIWNLVFMQYRRDEAGELHDLPATGIDTGAGLERILGVLQGVDSVFDIDVFRPMIEAAERVTGVTYGDDAERDVSLRIFAEHGRSTTMLVNDGVFPSNEDRGYVLRRIIRRAVRHAWKLGVETPVMPTMVDTAVEVMGDAYPDLRKNQGFIRDVIGREEESFRRTLAAGSRLLDAELADVEAGAVLPGDVAFTLHDTYGFPVELTEEVLDERGYSLDREGFEVAMEEQRTRAREAGRGGSTGDDARYRDLLAQFGETEFVRDAEPATGRVLAVLDGAAEATTEIFVHRTSFYAEAGGQIGDTGELRWDGGSVRVDDTTYAVPGLHRHVVAADAAVPEVGVEVETVIDGDRRASIRRNHTGTHILHWALREVLGEHVQQAGSWVGPDRMRFDFSHYEPVTAEQLAEIEDLSNRELLTNGGVRHYETTMDHATELGAIAFFGDKYGDVVRVLEAGDNSIELCGGTHVSALGDIGHLRVVSESSIGSNLRRIEAITGTATVERLRHDEDLLANLAQLLGVSPDELPRAVEGRLDEIKSLRKDLKAFEAAAATSKAPELAAAAVDGVVVARVDGLERDGVRDLVVAIRDQPGVQVSVIAGAPEGGGVVLVAAVTPDAGVEAKDLLADATTTIGGGGRPAPDLMVAGGRDAGGIDAALDQVRAAAGIA